MGGSGRDKHLKNKRKPRSRKPESKPHNVNKPPGITDSNPELGHTQCDNPGRGGDFKNENLNPCVNLNLNANDWKNLSDEQLEDLLLKKLEIIYNEAYSRLLAYGYDRDVARKALLTNGHAFGGMDILSNIVQNSLAYINIGLAIVNGSCGKGRQVFGDFSQLARYSLLVMVHLLQQVRPKLIKGDAMWCLLASNLNLGLASTIKVPFLPREGETKNENSIDTPYGFCKFPVDQDFGSSGCSGLDSSGVFKENFDAVLKRDVGLPKRFNLSPCLTSQLKKNVLTFASACRANMKALPEKSKALTNSVASNEQFDWENSDFVSLVFGSFDVDEKLESKNVDPKNEVILDLFCQIKEFEEQVKEQKEWAHQKVIQAAKKLCHDLSELKMLRMEREEKQQSKGNLELEDKTVKRLWEMENSLRNTSCQVDVATAAMRRLEKENLEIKSEVEAFELSASESDKICLEIAKRERKALKRLLTMEKHNNKLHEEIQEEKNNLLQLQQQLLELKNAQEETEVKWRQEVKAKELAIAQVQEELKLKKEVEVSLKRKQEALRQKMELDCQRCKDDVQRLEQEISHLQISLDSTDLHRSPNDLFKGESERTKPQRDTVEVMLPNYKYLPDFSEEEVICDRECLICMANEASIVFLPCAHQVLCANCNDGYCKNVEARCPCCQVRIVQRIRVYGTSS